MRWVLVSSFLAMARVASAQTATAEILGLVTDASSAAVAGASVTITRGATGESRTAATNQVGEFSFPLIEIGTYSVVVKLQGFQSQTVRDLRVETDQKVRQDFVLKVGEVTESVEVAANAVLLNTENATVGQVIENRRIIELPLNGRNISGLAVLIPGVQYGVRTGMNDGSGGFPIPGAGVSIIANGVREVYGTVALDGVDAKNPRTHITVFTPSIEAIEEFKVQTSSYTAEFGQGGGGIVQVSMKSGTNAFHGTVFEFLRNDKLDAETYFLNFQQPAGVARLPKDRLRRNQFGLVASGPVMLPRYNGRNRTFWAFNYEGRRETQERLATAFFPSDAFRAGDFSALLTPGINSATNRPFRAPIIVFDALTGDPFPDNRLPASRIHPGARNMLQYFPKPQFQQADQLDFTNRAAVPDIIGQNQYFWRIDHNFGAGDRVFVRYAGDRSKFDQEFINPAFPTSFASSATNLASQWIHTFNPTTLNEFRFGFNITDDDIANPRTNTDFDLDSLGIGQFRAISDGNRRLTKRETGIPLIRPFPIGDRDTGNGYDKMLSLQFADNISLHRGKHGWKGGVEYRRVTMDRGSANEPRGSMTFGANESGYDFASFLLGYPATVRSPEAFHPTVPLANRWSGYFLDDWKATSKLTVNAGLRYDYIGVPVDIHGGWRTLSLETLTGGLPTILPREVDDRGAVKLWNQEKRYFMPRLGIAYRPLPKWVVRASGGWFANVEHLNTFTILANMPPFGGSLEFNSVTVAGRTIPLSYGGQNYNVLTRRFSPASSPITLNDPFTGSQTIRPVNLLRILPNHRNPNHWQWSFDIQRELPWSSSLTIAYIGNKMSNVGNTISNFNSPDPSTNTNFQSRRPIQQFFDEGRVQTLGTLRVIDAYGNGSYNGLQTSLEKRHSSGLVFGLSYAFSKSLGDGESGGNEDGGFQDPRDRRASRGRYQFDQRHNTVFHFVYDLPFAKNLRGVPGTLLKGWQTNGILSLRSGFPFTITQGADLNTGGTPIRPDRAASGELDNPTRALWFDTSAFRRVSCNIPGRLDLCHYGNSGRSILESPGQRNLDFSAYKNFVFRESMRLQFRAELFNVTNSPYFGVPNGISFTSINSLVPDGPRNGEVRSVRTPMRIVQFGLKFFW